MTNQQTVAELAWIDTMGAWSVVGYAAAERALVDPHLSTVRDISLSSKPGDGDRPPSPSEFFGSWFSRSRDHRTIKGALHRPYSERYVADLGDMFREVAAECAAQMPDRGELMADFLTPFSMRSTARMMDIPDEELPLLGRVVSVLNTFLNGVPFNEKNLRAVEQCIKYLRALVDLLFEVENPGETVRALRRVAERSEAGRWSAVSTLGQLLTAGFEPMTTGAALAGWELHNRPELLAAARSGAVDVSDLAEEALRLNPPFPYIHRWAARPCDCYGVTLEPGTYVVIDLRRANRDPAVFEEPDTFRTGRERGDTLTYGRGPHYCLGIGLARAQIAVALRQLLDLDPPVRLLDAKVDDLGYFVAVRALSYERGGR